MSQLRQGGTMTHRCQIDCTNHEEVITALQLKSKDLYYFWRNYQWLYTRYEQSLLRDRDQPEPTIVKEIVQLKENHDKCNSEIEELEAANDKLTKENKKLRLQLQTSSKRVSDLQTNNKYEADYKKKILFLESKNAEFQAISQKQQSELTKLKNLLRQTEEQAESDKAKLVKDNKRLNQTIIELNQSLDELRSKPIAVPSAGVNRQQGPTLLQFEQFRSKLSSSVLAKLRVTQEQAERVISLQCESMRREVEEKVEDLLLSLTQKELQVIVQVIDQ